MRYRDILHTALKLTTNNPLLWLFGLVLYGGFNLYLINFFALFQQQQWDVWSFAVLGNTPAGIAIMLMAIVLSVGILNAAKIAFVILVHNESHTAKEFECSLCIAVSSQQFHYAQWFKRILLASGVTIVLTSSIALVSGSIIARYVQDNSVAAAINILATAIVICIIGLWNLFTGYYVVLHNMNFAAASKAALDIFVLRTRAVFEFICLLSLLYSVAVLVGNSFINVWQHGMRGMESDVLQLASLLLFILWFAVNNTFFNTALLLFFDTIVKSIAQDKPAVAHGQLQSHIVH